jgi:hypothetical protein
MFENQKNLHCISFNNNQIDRIKSIQHVDVFLLFFLPGILSLRHRPWICRASLLSKFLILLPAQVFVGEPKRVIDVDDDGREKKKKILKGVD